MRILQFAATGHGGLATHVATLAAGLKRDGYEVRVLCPSGSDLQRRCEKAGLAMDHLPFRVDASVARELSLLPAVFRYIRDHRFDVVHLHSTKAGVWGRLASAMAAVPVVVYTPNGYRFLRYPPRSPAWMFWAGVEWLMGRVAGYVVGAGPSEGRIARDLSLAAPDRLLVINNGVATRADAGTEGVRGRLGIPEKRPVVLKIGRLAGQKAPLDFVAAAVMVAKRVPEAVFVLIGRGDLEAAVRAAITGSGIAESFRLIESTDEIPALLRQTDVFVMTSKHEGLSYAAAEAAAARCGLVLSDVPGLRDLVVDRVSGRLVAPGDVAGFANAITELLQEPGRRRDYGNAAASLVAREYSVEKMVRETEALYARLHAAARNEVVNAP